MTRHSIRRSLRWAVAATVLLPVAIVLVIGLGGLLAGVGDAAGARGCGRVALALGVAWLTALAGTTLATASAVLEADTCRPRHRRPRWRRGRRRSPPPSAMSLSGATPSDRAP